MFFHGVKLSMVPMTASFPSVIDRLAITRYQFISRSMRGVRQCSLSHDVYCHMMSVMGLSLIKINAISTILKLFSKRCKYSIHKIAMCTNSSSYTLAVYNTTSIQCILKFSMQDVANWDKCGRAPHQQEILLGLTFYKYKQYKPSIKCYKFFCAMKVLCSI